MITLISTKDNELNDFCVNINEYYAHMEKMISYKLQCGCGIKGSCIKYGRYKRNLIINDKVVIIKLQRVYCKHCKKTHTIIPKFIIPYEQQSFTYILELINEYKCKVFSKADYELSRIMSNYNKWTNRLNSIGINISDGLNKVITFCASNFKMCFMQGIMRKNIKLIEVEYHCVQSPT